MGKKIGTQKNKSNKSGQQSALVALITLALFSISSCQTQSPVGDSKKPRSKDIKKLESEQKIKTITLLTDQGENSQAVFGHTENDILFISSGREAHDQSQVYSLDIKNGKVSRITFSDGIVMRPFISPTKESIIYSSTTDEDKERLNFEKLTHANNGSQSEIESQVLLGQKFPGSEIYNRKIKDDSIQRIRRAAGFDLAEDIDKSGKKILLTTHKLDRTEILIIDFNGALSKVVSYFAGNFLPSARFVPPVIPSVQVKRSLNEHTEVIWIQTKPDQSKSIVISEKDQKLPKTLFAKNGNHRDLAVSPDGQLFAFSSNFLDSKNMDIFISSIDGKCVQQITKDPAEDFFPAFSSDGKKMLITSRRSSHYEVYLIELNTDLAPTCLE